METKTKYGFDPAQSAVRIAPADNKAEAVWLDLNEFACGTWDDVLQDAADRFDITADGCDLPGLLTVLEVREVPDVFWEDGRSVSDDFLTLLDLIGWGKLDADDTDRFMNWVDYTGRTGDDLERALDEWEEADWGEYDTLGEWLEQNFADIDPDGYTVLDEHGLLDFVNFEDLAQYRYRYDLYVLDGHVYRNI